MTPWTPASLRGARPVFLLDLEFAGRTWHIGTDPIGLDSDSGPIFYTGGLDLRSISESFDRLETQPANQSASLSAELPEGASVLELLAKGHRLARCKATIALVYVDQDGVPVLTPDGAAQTWERRLVLLSGRVMEPQVGLIDKSNRWFGCSVRENLWEDRGRIIPAASRVNATTWPTCRDADLGKVYPTVFGQPGLSGFGAESYKGSPAYVVEEAGGDAQLLIIAGHPVAASEVSVIDDGATIENFAVEHRGDGLGNVCAVIDVSGAIFLDLTSGEFWIAWGETAVSNGGCALIDPTRDTAITGLGSLLGWLLQRSTIPVDYGRCEVARRQLDRIEIAGYINDPDAKPWDYIADELLSLAPLSVRRGPQGVYPLPRLDIPPASALPSLTESADFRRLIVQYEDPDPISSVEVPYVPGSGLPLSVRWVQSAVLASADDTLLSGSTLLSAPGADGRSERKTSGLLWTRAAADAVAVGTILAHPLEVLTVSYSAASHFGWLSPGDWVAMTDDDLDRGLFWTDRIGQVAAREWDGTAWQFSIVFEIRPLARPRRFG